jgi:hypothetical protein
VNCYIFSRIYFQVSWAVPQIFVASSKIWHTTVILAEVFLLQRQKLGALLDWLTAFSTDTLGWLGNPETVTRGSGVGLWKFWFIIEFTVSQSE